MNAANFCSQCGAHIKHGVEFCPNCGIKIDPTEKNSPSSNQHVIRYSAKSSKITFILCLFLGMIGAHRFYVGKIGTGFLMIITAGGFGLWVLFDLLTLINNKFEDKQGNLIELSKSPSPLKKILMNIGGIIAWLLVFFITIVTLVNYLTSGVVGVVRDQLSSLRAGNIQEAYSYTSKDFQKSTSMNEFKKFLNRYPSLKTNKSSFFNVRKVENSTGFVQGTLTSKDDAKTPIEYQLIKEDGQWKILGITVKPTGTGGIDSGYKTDSTDNNESSKQDSSSKLFEDKNNRFSIRYPTNWEYTKPEKGTVLFHGKEKTPAYYSTVNIQTVLTKKTGGNFSTVNELADDLKSQIMKRSSNAKILDQGDAQLPTNPTKVQGKYLIFTYDYQGQSFQQMQFVLIREDNLLFYTWAYTSPKKQYKTYLPKAQTMYESWKIE